MATTKNYETGEGLTRDELLHGIRSKLGAESHYRHSDSPHDGDPAGPGRVCGPHCPYFEDPEPRPDEVEQTEVLARWHDSHAARVARIGLELDGVLGELDGRRDITRRLSAVVERHLRIARDLRTEVS